MTEFKREDRYLVIKRKDLAKLSPLSKLKFNEWFEDNLHALPDRKYVVVESDWLEYETVFKMIEARVTGHAAPQPQQTPDSKCRRLETGTCNCTAYCGAYLNSTAPQPQQVAQKLHSCEHGCNGCDECTDYDDASAQYGPVADGWQLSVTDGHSGYSVYAHMTEYPEEGAVLLLSIAPPQAPLTLEQINSHIGADEGDREAVIALVREVEAMHGIRICTEPAHQEHIFDSSETMEAKLLEALEILCNGLEWNIKNHPTIMNQADEEALLLARAVIAQAEGKA
jgi:hypothetical protein